jgi:hypothetical protein
MEKRYSSIAADGTWKRDKGKRLRDKAKAETGMIWSR